MTNINGNITRRGRSSWRIKYEIGRDPVTDKRRTQFETVRGTKKDAHALLAKRVTEVGEGAFIARDNATVADYARHWLMNIAPAKASAKTRERYGEIIEKHIIPQIGSTPLQKLDGTVIDKFYAHLSTAGRLDGKGGLLGTDDPTCASAVVANPEICREGEEAQRVADRHGADDTEGAAPANSGARQRRDQDAICAP